MLKVIIDTKTSNEYFIIYKTDGKEFFKVSKKSNCLEDIKRMVGILNIEEIR